MCTYAYKYQLLKPISCNSHVDITSSFISQFHCFLSVSVNILLPWKYQYSDTFYWQMLLTTD